MERQKSYFEIAGDPAFWETVRTAPAYARFRDDLLKKWETLGTCPLPAMKFSEYRLYFDNGNRSVYENVYFLRRRALNDAAFLALIYPDEPAYLSRLEDVIYAILGEYTWCLPAHQPNITEDIPDHLDLFACETGSAFGEIEFLLGARLSPLIRTLIRKETQRRVIDPYLAGRKFWWQTANNNWAAVCCGSVAVATWCFCPDLFPQLLPRFRATMDCFLSGFGDDGFCVEGLSYWGYGFGYFLCYADLERYVTDGEYDYFKLPKVKAIATFAQKMFLSGNATVSFSDGPRTGEPEIDKMHYLRREYGTAVTLLPLPASHLAAGCARFCLDSRTLAWFDPSLGVDAVPQSTAYAAKDAGWWIVKNPAFGFAAKAGCNKESHNHNDVGTFIVAKDGRQIFGDLGAGPYCRQYFSRERYEFLTCSSRGHSVPFFGTLLQQEGAERAADHVTFGENTFSFGFAGAYAASDDLKALTRTFTVTPQKITVTDRFDWRGAAPVTERYLLLAEPTLTGGGFTAGGLTCRLFGNVAAKTVTPIEAVATPLDAGKLPPAWFLDVELSPGAEGCTLEVMV